MKRIQIVNPYVKADGLHKNVSRSLTGDLKTVALNGVEIEILLDENAEHIVMRTKYPVSILQTPTGEVLSVIEKRK